MSVITRPGNGLPRGFVPPAAALAPQRMSWGAVAIMDEGGYREMRLAPAGDSTPFPDLGAMPVIAVRPLRMERPHHVPGPSHVTLWSVEAGALSPIEAYGRLGEAEPLLVERMMLLRDGGFRPWWFWLVDGKLLDPCAHPDAVPVDTLWTQERVAWLCPGCDAQLPADWA